MSQYKSQQPFGATNQSRGVADQMRNLSFGSVLIGAAVGVIVGLILGWQVWPVKWTEAWPTDLSQEAKAQYLAAVAQVYAYYPDDRAAETARTRLYGLQDNIGDEIAAAQNFFAENPQRDSNVYITMLAEMAAGLGVETGAPPLIDGVTDPAAGDGAASTADAAAASDGPSLATWLLRLLGVLALVGGGIYIISRLANSRRNRAQPDDGSAPPRSGYAGAQPAPAGQSGGFDMPAPDDYKFDHEPDEGIVFTAGSSVTADQEFEDDTFFDDESASNFAQPGDNDAAGYSDTAAYADPAEYADTPAYPPAPSETEQFARPAAATAAVVSSAREQEPVNEQQAPAATQAAQTQTAKILNTYVLHYQSGVAEYEQSHNIIDPGTSRYIGECGMGVNMKNGILQDVPENVIALDVWLFDQKQDRSLGNQTRVLLSEYAIDNDLEQVFLREQPDGPTPVVAQPGVSFQLKGEGLVLDCEILEADYTSAGQESGIFQNVKVEMTVRTRT